MRYKRVDMLIRFMVRIVEEQPDALLDIAGAGPVDDALKRLVRSYGLEDHVVFHGHVSEAEKVRLLQEAWVLVTASMKEGWGLVVIEANACGTPAIAFNVPGLCESIAHTHTGLLAESEEDFVALVLRTLGDHGLRRDLSQNAVKFAGRFSWDEAAEKSLMILTEAVEGKRTPSRVVEPGQVGEQGLGAGGEISMARGDCTVSATMRSRD